MSLPRTIFNFATQTEDAAVESLLIERLGPESKTPLRVMTVAACGANAISMCASPDVDHVDAVDPAMGQLRLGALLRTAVATFASPDQVARFIGNSGEPGERKSMYAEVREGLDAVHQQYWDAHEETVTAGILDCGGAERCFAIAREHLPSRDLESLSRDADVLLTALSRGITMETQRQNMFIPEAAMKNIAEHGVPVIAAQLFERVKACAGGEPDFMVEMIVNGRLPMEPATCRPLWLQPDVFAAVRQNGCGPDRLQFHEGVIQGVGPELADAEGAYDFVAMSNILDMASPEEAVDTVRAVASAVTPGGTMVCRSHRPAGSLAPIFEECGLRVDADLSAEALDAETSFFMNDVCVVHA